MSELRELLALSCVRLDVVASTAHHVLDEAARVLAAQHSLRKEVVADALWAREQLASTALGQGVALPHARIPGLRVPYAAYLRLAPAFPFDAPDDRPVRDVFVLLVPERANEHHLQLLAQVAQAFAEPDWREQLHQQTSPALAHRLLCDAVRLPAGI